MSLRKEFVFKVLGKEASIAELSRQYGISRKTAYKWLRRFKKHGVAGLLDESKKPKRSPTQMADAMRLEIVRLRQEHPTWGAKKLRVLLLRNSESRRRAQRRSNACSRNTDSFVVASGGRVRSPSRCTRRRSKYVRRTISGPSTSKVVADRRRRALRSSHCA